MWKIVSDISGNVHEYAGEGRWVAANGLRFDSESAAQARLDADIGRINPRIRSSVRVSNA